MRTRILLVLAALLAIAAIPGAAAHAQLVSVDPPIDQQRRLETPPTQFTLTFSQNLDPSTSTIQVWNTTQPAHEVDLGSPLITHDPPVMKLALPHGLPAGTYIVKFNAVSADDGHPDEGTLPFAIGNIGNRTLDAAVTQSVNQLDGWSAVSRGILYAGFSLTFAAVAFLLWMPAQSPRVTANALVVGTALHFVGLMILFSATYRAAGGHDLRQYLGSPDGAGPVYLARSILGAGAFVMATIGALRPTRLGPYAVAVVMLGAALGSARLGHGYVQGLAPFAIDFVHLLAASVWVGGLVLFAVWLRPSRARLPADVQQGGIRFGTIALTAVCLLALSGVVLAVYTIGAKGVLHPIPTLGTAYGAFLAGKIAIGLAMVALAGVNRYVMLEQPQAAGIAGFAQKSVRLATAGKVRPGLADGSHFGRMVAVEAVLGVAVLALAGFLTSVSPPAANAAVAGSVSSEPFTASGSNPDFEVQIDFHPAPRQGGTSNLTLAIFHIRADGSREPIVNNTCGRASCVTVQLQYAGGSGPEAPQDVQLQAGVWNLPGMLWSTAGPANATVTLSAPPITFQTMLVVPFTVATTG